jgi:ABC-type transporter Mla subunit MlaD
MLGIGIKNVMEVRDELSRLTSIVAHMGEAIISTTETVEKLAEKVDAIAVQLQTQGHHVQQQSYQIFALSDALQTLVDSQADSKKQVEQLMAILKDFVLTVKESDNPSLLDSRHQ